MTYRALVIGLGAIGMGYDLDLEERTYALSHARALSTHSRFELVAGVDPDASRREMFQAAYDRDAYGDLESALTTHSPDLVVIAVPTAAHAAIVGRVLRYARPLAILCEKPLAYDVKEARRILDECAGGAVKLFVNYIRRSEPAAVEVRRRIVEGDIVGPFKGVAWYTKGFLHSGSHLFNLLMFWLGPVIDASLADAGRRCEGDLDQEPDVRVRFERGTVMFIAVRDEDFSYHALELLGRNGRLRYDHGGHRVEWTRREPEKPGSTGRQLGREPEILASEMDRYQWHVANQLSLAMDGVAAEICTGTEALTTLECIRTIINPRDEL